MTVGSVVKAIAILRHLSGSEPLGVNAVARAVELSPSTCFNILKTLLAEEFVDFDPTTKAYRLGSAPAHLFSGSATLGSWKVWLRERLEPMAARHALSCGVWEVWAQRVVLAEVIDSGHLTRIHLSTGQRLPSHIGAMGRCVIAHEGLDRADVGKLISRLRWQSPPAPDDYWRDIVAARKNGWSVDEGNYLRGVTTIAAPVADSRGKLSHCLTATMFSGQHDHRTLEAIGRELGSVAAEAQRRLDPT